MNYFARALREGLRYWPALVAAVCCSIGVAALWGANIAALFPIIETTLSGKSLQQWNADRLTGAQQQLVLHEQQLATVRAKLAGADGDEEEVVTGLRLEAELLDARTRVDRATVASAERLRPFAERWLPTKPFHTVALVVALVLAATTIRVVLLMANAVLVSYVSQGIARDLRGTLFEKALSLDRQTFAYHGVSGFQAHITHTTDMLVGGLSSFYAGAITEPLRILACLIGATCISWRLTLASLVFAPLAAYLILVLNRRVRSLTVRVLDRSLGFHHVILEVLGALPTVQAYTMERFERDRFRGATGQMRHTAILAAFYGALSNPITELLGMGMLCTGLTVSSYLVLNQATSIFGIPMCDEPLGVPAVTVFFGMLIGAADPLRKLSGVVNGVNTGMAAANILYPLLETPTQVAEPVTPTPLPRPLRRIEVRDVHFSYDGVHQVLTGASLTIEAGERVALVGHNGCGKSTLVSLLCRFYDPQSGVVAMDGVPLREASLEDLRSRIAVVSQQAELFNETVLHNIRYGRWDASDDDVYAAAQLARADEFVRGFPEGYQTIVGANGQRLSGGQRQRVALARAFLRDADLLILDEATSQVDSHSERLIHEALAEYAEGRTVIFITHRESTLSLATRVVRVEGGRLVEADDPKVVVAA